MSELVFDPNKTVLGDMKSMSRTDIVALGKSLCDALPNEGCHGAIWPGAISKTDDAVALSAPLDGEITNLDANALEYAAPELFWRGERTPAADIYSVGMLLYIALNGGANPFYPEGGDADLKQRADALRRRMNGEAFPPLKNCGKKLTEAVMRAVSYDEGDRFAAPADFKAALEACPVLPAAYAGFTPAALLDTDPELAKALDEEMGTSTVADSVARTAAKKEYKVSKDFENEPVEPTEKESRAPFIVCLIVAALAILIFLLSRACVPTISIEDPVISPAVVSPAVVSPAPDESPAVSDAPENSDKPDASPDVSGDPNASPDVSSNPNASPNVSSNPSTAPESPQTSGGAIVTSPTPRPTPTATPTPTPTPTPTATPTPTPNTVTSGSFTMVRENVSWETAKARCEAMGGHLAVIHNEEELEAVIAMAEELGASYVWLGAKRNADTGEMEWVTGEEIDYYVWDLNEPSFKDGYDGTLEDYLLLWKVSFGDHSGWKYNDSRPDIFAYSNKIFGGKIAYICQMD